MASRATAPLTTAVGHAATVTYNQLIKVGFSPSQAAFLFTRTTAQYGTQTDAYKKQFTFSKQQARTLKAGDLTMKSLLRSGFTRAQAQLLRKLKGL